MGETIAKSPRKRGDYLSRAEALEILGIKPQTLYCYVSRGYIRSLPQPGGRSSYYSREDVERVRAKSVARSGHGPAAASAMRWGEPIIETAITEITDRGPRHRTKLAGDLARGERGRRPRTLGRGLRIGGGVPVDGRVARAGARLGRRGPARRAAEP